MDMPVNSFKRALASGATPYGVWLVSGAPATAEALGSAGFDFLVVDTEHTPIDPPQVSDILRTIAGTPASAIVRPPWNDMVMIKRLLDIGTQSFLIPYVQDEAEAKAAVEATRYPPHGMRGFASAARSSRFGRVKDYHTRAAEELCVLLQVETTHAMGNLEAIAGVEGVDGIFIGPGDLSADMGRLGQPGHPEVDEAVRDAIRRIRACGKAPGVLTGDEKLARGYVEAGALFVAVGSDTGLLVKGSEQLAQRFKGGAGA